MARFDSDALIEEVLAELQGQTLIQEQYTWLTDPVSDTTTTLPVEAASQLSRGVAEVGDELVLIARRGSGNVTLAPFGRGFQGTEAQEHAVNARVTFSPRFPRYRIKNTINDLIREVFPTLFAVDTHVFSASAPVIVTYELPADAEDVLTAKQQVLGASKDWEMLYNWRFDRAANSDEFATGRTLDVWDWIIPGRDIQVTYLKRPTEMNTSWDDTGLAESAWPAIKFGVLYRLTATQESGISALNSVKAAEAQRRRGHSPTELSLQYYRMHLQHLQDERSRLLADHEVTANTELY